MDGPGAGGASSGAAAAATETLEQMQARHRKEAKDLQGRVTSKKKNATKKTRKGVNDECAEMERQMRERQAEELAGLTGGGGGGDTQEEQGQEQQEKEKDNGAAVGEEDAEEKAAKMMHAMVLNGLAAKPPQQPAASPSSSKPPEAGGKKRNRQKERLARRAAEQEAAAEAAEQEAAGMTDHRGRERERMAAEFARHGLEEHEIRPDGHCLFSAVADQLGQCGIPLAGEGGGGSSGGGGDDDDETHKGGGGGGGELPGYKVVRRAAAGYIESRGDEFAGFLEEDLGSYVRKMRDTAEWGGQLELIAVASVYGVEVCVVQDGRTEVIQPSGGGDDDGKGVEGGERKKIWLAYYRHGYGLGEHYNSLRKKA